MSESEFYIILVARLDIIGTLFNVQCTDSKCIINDDDELLDANRSAYLTLFYFQLHITSLPHLLVLVQQ